MKKMTVVSFMIIFCMLLSCFPLQGVAAESTQATIEAEAYDKLNNILPTTTANSKFSASKAIAVYALPDGSNEYSIEYTLAVEQGGWYYITGISSIVSVSYTTDYFISVNDGEKFDVKNSVKLEDIDTGTLWPDVMKKYSYGSFKLHEGVNKVKIILNSNDVTSSGKMVLYFDCLNLVYATEQSSSLDIFRPVSITADRAVNVFEAKETVGLKINFSSETKNPITYGFLVRNAWGKTEISGKLTCNTGVKSHYMNLGILNVGWYEFVLYNSDMETEVGLSASFSVVKPPAERMTNTDTPFAAMTAAQWWVDSQSYPAMEDALKYAGIQWVRECANVPLAADSIQQYDELIDQFSKKGIKITDLVGGGLKNTDHYYYQGDLREIYNVFKNMTERYKDKLPSVEILNEVDWGAGYAPADLYASFMKAASVGVYDGNPSTYKSFAGLAQTSTATPFVDLMFQNGIMDYTDFYNAHLHVTTYNDGVTNFKIKDAKKQIATNYAYSNGDAIKPLWMTEAGMKLILGADGGLSYSQLQAQARYVVTSIAQSVACGTGKQFWFMLPSMIETNGEYGILKDDDRSPQPAYSALSTMTYTLGNGTYKGELKGLSGNSEGYMFHNGKNDVAVVWSTSPSFYQFKAGGDVKITDLYGSESIRKPCCKNGYINVPISCYPIYIEFNGEADVHNYYAQKRNNPITTASSFDQKDKLVLQQVWDGEQDLVAAKTNGYVIKNGTSCQIKLNVYNFSDTPQSGTINAISDDCFTLDTDNASFSIEPMGKQELLFNIAASPTSYVGATGYIRFDGQLSDGSAISQSVSMAMLEDTGRTVNDVIRFAGFENPDNWDLTNIGNNVTMDVQTNNAENGIDFDITVANRSCWFYPKYEIPDSNALSGSAGMSYTIKADSDFDLVGGQNVFVYMKDGRSYAQNTVVTYYDSWQTDWTQVNISWKKLKLFDSPAGVNVDTNVFDPAEIKAISIGGGTSAVTGHKIPKYTVKNFGFYFSDHPADRMVYDKTIELDGITYLAKYDASQPLTVTASIPEGDYRDYKVLLNGKLYENYTVNDYHKAIIHFNNLEDGKYNLVVSAMDRFGYAVRAYTEFYIDGQKAGDIN